MGPDTAGEEVRAGGRCGREGATPGGMGGGDSSQSSGLTVELTTHHSTRSVTLVSLLAPGKEGGGG